MLANISKEIVLGMLFLAISNADFMFDTEKFTWRSYTITKALTTTNRMEFINKKEFAKAVLDKNSETFVLHILALEATENSIHPSQAAQIAALQWDKAFFNIPIGFSDNTDVFSLDLAIELPEKTGINEHILDLIEEKQTPYGPIYVLSLVEMETLKTYIKTY